MDFPALDEWGTPTEKLPDCPRCGEDELGVIHEGLLLCYCCSWRLERAGGDAGPNPAGDPAPRGATDTFV